MTFFNFFPELKKVNGWHRPLVLACALAGGAAAEVRAQADIGVGISPGLFGLKVGIAVRERAAPLALAVEMAVGPEVWGRVRVSTDGAAADLTRLVREGFYKRELIQLVLLCAWAERPLEKTAARRREGIRLRDLAGELRVDYEALAEASSALEEIVDREYLPRFPERRMRRRREE